MEIKILLIFSVVINLAVAVIAIYLFLLNQKLTQKNQMTVAETQKLKNQISELEKNGIVYATEIKKLSCYHTQLMETLCAVVRLISLQYCYQATLKISYLDTQLGEVLVNDLIKKIYLTSIKLNKSDAIDIAQDFPFVLDRGN